MRRQWLSIVLATFLATTCSGLAWAELQSPFGEYYSLVNEQNDLIHQTASQMFPGDIYIAGDNSKYEVVEVAGYTARCTYQGKEIMPTISDNFTFETGALLEGAVPTAQSGAQPTIAIYHTHSDESYVPTDGRASIPGHGGIYDVGAAFAEKLEQLGYNVEYSEENHNPNDINAYNRSRKTAASLIKKAPDAIIDIHRDAVPPGAYQTQINGEEATKIKLIVGRTNPNMKTNLEFAKNIKAAMDKKAPGLSAGILVGKGSYNQDLSPRAMLIEVGTHNNDKSAAIKGVQAFAEVMPAVLGSAGGTGGEASPAQKPAAEQGAGTTILIILIVVAAAAGGFYLLNKASLNK